MTASETQGEGFVVVCDVCGETWGPYNGSSWKTPREQAKQAVGGINRTHPHSNVSVIHSKGDGRRPFCTTC